MKLHSYLQEVLKDKEREQYSVIVFSSSHQAELKINNLQTESKLHFHVTRQKKQCWELFLWEEDTSSMMACHPSTKDSQ